MNEDKIFEIAELLSDEAFGKNGVVYYSERQEMTSKFNEILVKNLIIQRVVGRSEQLVCSCGSIKVQTTGGAQCPNNRCSSAN